MLSQASSDLPLTPKEISFLTFLNDLRGDRTMPERSEIVPEDRPGDHPDAFGSSPVGSSSQ